MKQMRRSGSTNCSERIGAARKFAMLTTRKNLTVLAVFLLIPFIQLGYEYYLSVQIVTFVLMSSLLRVRDFSLSVFIPASCAALLMVMPLPFLPVADLAQEALKVGRILLCIMIMLLLLSNRRKTEHPTQGITAAVFFLSCALFALVVVQQIAGGLGVLFYFPRDWYVTNGENLADELSLYFGLARPTATFGEPSYLGFVVFSIYMIALTTMRESTSKTICCFVLWGTAIVSSTLAGVLALTASTALHFYRKRVSTKLFLIFLVAVAIAYIGMIYFTPDKLIYRFENFGDSDLDASTYARLVQSSQLMFNTIVDYPFGIPTELLLTLTGIEKSVTDNGVIMFVVNFGFTSFIIISIFLKLLWQRPMLGLYLLLGGMFNGTIFGYDKVTIMGLVIFLVGVEVVAERRERVVQAGTNGGAMLLRP